MRRLDSHPISELVAAMRKGQRYPGIDSMLVVRDGQLIIEEYFGTWTANKLHDSRSSFKSVTSLLLGIAIDRGLLALDSPVADHLPAPLVADLPTDSPKRRITVHHLVTMTAGFDCEEFYDRGPDCESEMWNTDDWVAFSWSRPLAHAPGQVWSYTSGEPVLVGAVIAHAAGESVFEFAREHLFQPLGIVHYRWTRDRKGNAMTGGSFFMRPRDWAKIGQLVLDRGTWRGRQIVSSSWIDRATRATHELAYGMNFARIGGRIASSSHAKKFASRNVWPGQTPTRYGFYWYREKLRFGTAWKHATEVVFASGNGGQYIMVFPAERIIAVFTGSHYNNWRGKWPFDIMIHHILPALDSTAPDRAPDHPEAVQQRQ
ncbi:MAG: beta-lactamase family protein [Proteobacteria bacterium]|nr:beta-lactamase family protein [Pseudomonadota bacterium]